MSHSENPTLAQRAVRCSYQLFFLSLILAILSYFTNFMTERDQALPVQGRTRAPFPGPETEAGATNAPVQVGAWETRTPRGEVLTWIFTADEVTMILPKGRSAPFPYEIDFAQEPAWLTVYSDRYGKPPMLMIVKFVGEDRMLVVGSAPGSQARPLDFGKSREDILTFSKRL